MEQNKESRNSFVDWLIIALAIITAELIRGAVGIQGEMAGFFFVAAVVVVLVGGFYVIRYLLKDRYK